MTADRLRGKVVVVTGAAQGQGAAMARALADQGAEVIATDVVDGPGIRRLDVTSSDDWTALADRLGERHGRVDGLVNNAGITRRARLGDIRPADFHEVQAVNVLGPLLGMQKLGPLMPPGSSIVNIGSAAGLTGHYPVAYTASVGPSSPKAGEEGGLFAACPRPPASNSAHAASGSTSCTPASSRHR